MKQPTENPSSINDIKWFLSSNFARNFLLLAIIVLLCRYIYFMILFGLLIYLYLRKRQTERRRKIEEEPVEGGGTLFVFQKRTIYSWE
ncbi:MAG: hypothetical protein ACXADY_21190 [Candidatus Hodarchaeales archaeon]